VSTRLSYPDTLEQPYDTDIVLGGIRDEFISEDVQDGAIEPASLGKCVVDKVVGRHMSLACSEVKVQVRSGGRGQSRAFQVEVGAKVEHVYSLVHVQYKWHVWYVQWMVFGVVSYRTGRSRREAGH
jgi:hypothetical protein